MNFLETMTSNVRPCVKLWMLVQYTVPSRLMLWLFFANTTGAPKISPTIAAMPMPEASMVRILLMGLSAKWRCHSRAISMKSLTSI